MSNLHKQAIKEHKLKLMDFARNLTKLPPDLENKLFIADPALAPIDSSFQYDTFQAYYTLEYEDANWIISLSKYYGSEVKKGYGTRSFMNDLFHLAALRERSQNANPCKLLIVPISVKPEGVMSLNRRVQAAICSLLSWSSISQNYSVEVEMFSGFDERLLGVSFFGYESDIERKIKEALEKPAENQVNFSLKRVTKGGKERYSGHKVDIVNFFENICEIIEIKDHSVDREAFIELLQNLYAILVVIQELKDNKDQELKEEKGLVIALPDCLGFQPPLLNIPKIDPNIIKLLGKVSKIVLRAVGTEQFYGENFAFSGDFNLMQKKLLEEPLNKDDIVILH